jgi:membrane protease YdiL (CAAX protease family)
MFSGLTPPKLPLALEPFSDVSWFQSASALPALKSLLPFPILLAIAWPLWWYFRNTWKQLDQEARETSLARAARGETDYRPAVCLVLSSAILTVQEYYGGRGFYDAVLKPEMVSWELAGAGWLKMKAFDNLYAYAWWSAARVLGYVLVPILFWKLLFRDDELLDYGLRVKGFFKHIWIYLGLLAFIVPVMLVVAQQPDFGSYYPFYKLSSRSWFDFLAWELMYYAQFFALEFFFRGWMVGALRGSLGASAIFVMAVPYCMIHYGKPYLEAHGAIVAGVVLGTLAMKTRSVYAGFLVHIAVAAGMDFLSLYKRGALPTVFWPAGGG